MSFLHFLEFHGFLWFSMGLRCSRDTMSENLCHPGASCAAGLSPAYMKFWCFWSSRTLDLRPGCRDAGCCQDWNGLEWLAARWEEGIQGHLRCSTLQEVGRFSPHFSKRLAVKFLGKHHKAHLTKWVDSLFARPWRALLAHIASSFKLSNP